MRRFSAGLLSFAVLLSAPAPAAWAQAAASARAVPALGPIAFGVVDASRAGATLGAPVASLAPIGASAAATLEPGPDLGPAETGSRILETAAPLADAVGPAAAEKIFVGVREENIESARASLASGAATPAALDRLFTGAVDRESPPDGPFVDARVSSPPAAARRLLRFRRVLPDERRNRAFWTMVLVQSLATMGVNFYYSALPSLAAPTKADSARLGYNRAVNWGAQAAGSLATGAFIDRRPAKSVMISTYVGRGMLMAAVPVLFATGHLGFAVLALLIGAAGFLSATGATAGAVAFNRVLGNDPAYYNRANAIMTVVTSVVGVASPLLAGAFIACAGSFFAAPLMGSALSFGVCAAFLLAAGAGCAALLKVPGDETFGSREKSGVSPRRALRDVVEGFRLAWSDRFLRLTLCLTALSTASGDYLVFALIPRYLSDVLKTGPGAFGLLLAASSLGLGLASAAMTLARSTRLAKKPVDGEKARLDALERQGQWSYLMHAASWLAYAGVFFAHSLLGSAALMLVSAVLAAPGGIIWAGLTTRAVAGSFPNDQGKVYAAMTFYGLACSMIGVLSLGWLMAGLSTATALSAGGGILAVCALLDVILSLVVFPLRRSLRGRRA